MIFRRDLRLEDNTALCNALSLSNKVTPIFIFDPRQIGPKNRFLSHPALFFMRESLTELEDQLEKIQSKLHYGYGEAEAVITDLLQTKQFDAVFFNRDYTPFSRERDLAIQQACKTHHVACNEYHDLLLIGDPAELLTANSTPYRIFGAFFKAAARHTPTQKPQPLPDTSPLRGSKTITLPPKIQEPKEIKFERALHLHVHGGSTHAKKQLAQLIEQKNYTVTRNIPAHKTTLLSAHNKFGTLSVREAVKAISTTLGPSHELIRQLYWRDFFSYLVYHYPESLKNSARPTYEPKKWSNSTKAFTAWCEGKTGIPIIDAGMRELNESGYVHNRVRMLAASFLVKNLGIDWRTGAQYFAQKLTDYDPSVNAGNWQWISSTGYDAQPYFRVFNPWLQQKKFDPECRYIKLWVPELRPFAPAQIHNPKSNYSTIYPAPLVDILSSSRAYIQSHKKNTA